MPKHTNISSILILGTGALAFPGCSAAAGADQYELIAYEAPGMIPIAGEIIIPDARQRIPPIVRGCGIADVETQDRTDGAVAFRFHASSDQLPCLKAALPSGTRLHSFGPQENDSGAGTSNHS